MGTISDSLRSVGSLDYLWKAVQGKFDGTKSLNTPVGDAFSLWHENFKNFGMNQMAQRISKLEIAHNFLLREGLPKVGIRMIDHGIAGGMLLLLCSTQYFRMHFGLLDASFSDSEIDKQIKIQFDSRKDNPSWEYDAAWWWKAVVWATAAVAMHNVQTMTSWPGCDRQSMKLAVSDDPLTYLGVLVDTLQDWDRYTSSRDSIFTEKLPVSSTNMKLGDENGIAILDYGDADVAEKIRADLSKILVDWEKIIKILPAKKI